MEKKSLTVNEIKFRQSVSSTILLYISNLCTDYQLNPNFKAQNPDELKILESLKHILNLPCELKDDTYVTPESIINKPNKND